MKGWVAPCRSCGDEHTGPGSRDVPGAIAKLPAEPLGDEDVDVAFQSELQVGR